MSRKIHKPLSRTHLHRARLVHVNLNLFKIIKRGEQLASFPVIMDAIKSDNAHDLYTSSGAQCCIDIVERVLIAARLQSVRAHNRQGNSAAPPPARALPANRLDSPL